MLKKINKDIYLDDIEINILKKYNINYEGVKSYDEILLIIDMNINSGDFLDEELDDLDYVSNMISERKYYTKINKQ